IAIKDMFTHLAATVGEQEIHILSAALHLFRYQGSSTATVYVNRVTTDWLPDAAGTNENDVSGLHSEVNSGTPWAAGSFSTSDYDTTVTGSSPWADGYNEQVVVDVTEVIAAIYASGVNYGVVLTADAGGITGRASEHSTHPPSLEITYTYGQPPPTYTLTVHSGSGDGSYFAAAVVSIQADPAPSGQAFDVWIGDTVGIASLHDADTTITMPPTEATITATYQPGIPHTLTVNSGSGDGSYIEGTVVSIQASP
ncbi:unnamed protein product, partial [marine sediment metagenome]